MPFYEVKTQSAFECLYLVEAKNEKEAQKKALDYIDGYYMQKHLGEEVQDATLVTNIQDELQWYKKKEELGYD